MGVKDIHQKMSNGYVWKIHKVRHVPELMHNLISIGQLDEERHNVTFTNGAWKVTKGVMVIAPENKTGTLYMTSSCRDMVSVINSNANSDLWHFRLKHEWKRNESTHIKS